MVYKKTIYVKSKVFKAEDIIELVNILEKEVKEREYKIKCNILFEDNTEIEDRTLEPFFSKMFLKKKVKELTISCYKELLEEETTIRLEESQENTYRNRIEIYSENEDSFNSMIYKIENVLKNVEKQKVFSKCNYEPIIALVIFILMIAAYIIAFVQKYIKVYYLWGLGITAFLLCFIATYIAKAYPEVEFDFGPEYQNRAKRKKNSLNWFVATILIPIILVVIEKIFFK